MKIRSIGQAPIVLFGNVSLPAPPRRIAKERTIAISDDGQYTCFNTGLVTPHQEPIYASFEANRRADAQPWFFKGCFHRGQCELNRFAELPSCSHQRVRRNYEVAIPQCYRGQVQLLLPLCFGNPQVANLALVVERHQTSYRASTCLTLDMAYSDARQLARPDRDSIQPKA